MTFHAVGRACQSRIYRRTSTPVNDGLDSAAVEEFIAAPRLHARVPGPALAREVSLLWHYLSPALAHPRERVLPTGDSQLIVNLREDAFAVYTGSGGATRERRRGSLFVGPRTESTLIDTDRPVAYVGAIFRPGGASAFVPCPLRDLRNEELDADALWGAQLDEWRDRLIAAATAAARLDTLERLLLGLRRPAPGAHAAVAWALRELSLPEPPAVASLIGRVGYSGRHFINLFSAQVGLTPKQYQRLQRFQRVARDLHERRVECLATAALDCGYYDQAHFCHDFRSFSGLSPTQYLDLRTPHHNHIQAT